MTDYDGQIDSAMRHLRRAKMANDRSECAEALRQGNQTINNTILTINQDIAAQAPSIYQRSNKGTRHYDKAC